MRFKDVDFEDLVSGVFVLIIILLFIFVLTYITPMIIMEQKERQDVCERNGLELISTDTPFLKCIDLDESKIETFYFKCDWGFYDIHCIHKKLNVVGDLE